MIARQQAIEIDHVPLQLRPIRPQYTDCTFHLCLTSNSLSAQ
jgi:hypothetical protein